MQHRRTAIHSGEVAGIMDAYCDFLFIPNVVSMSYTDEVKKGVKAGRMVLQVGVTKELKKHTLPKKVLFGEKSIPIQVVREGKLKLCCDSVEAGACLRVTHGEMWKFGTLGAREESVG